jgi:hypothetical protein
MAEPYSERFCLVQKPGSPLMAFTVPAQKRAILRSVSYYGYLATSPAIFLRLAGIYIFAALPQAQTFGASTDMYQVAYAGEIVTLEVTAGQGDMGAAVSWWLTATVDLLCGAWAAALGVGLWRTSRRLRELQTRVRALTERQQPEDHHPDRDCWSTTPPPSG